MSYTNMAPKSSPKDMATIAESIGDGRIHFAGEHTHFEFLGCTHTAMISGLKAAERIAGRYISTFAQASFLLSLISSASSEADFINQDY
jgi:monoamine oxidase